VEKIEGDLPEELSKLCSHIRKLLSQLKPMLKQVLWAWRIVFGIWKILRDGYIVLLFINVFLVILM